MEARIETIRTSAITAPHDVRDNAKLADMIRTIEDGESLPMMVVVANTPIEDNADPDDYQGITGSHRLAAMRATGVSEVEAIVIYATAEDHDEADGRHDNWQRLIDNSDLSDSLVGEIRDEI